MPHAVKPLRNNLPFYHFPAAIERRMRFTDTDDVVFIVKAKPDDSGTYSCTAKNIVGSVVTNTSITVLGKCVLYFYFALV